MIRPKIRLEATAGGVRIGCTACPHWHAFAADRRAGHQSASAHEKRVHPGEYRARNAAKMYARRHPESADTPTQIMNV
ncbi:hypothetical protein E3V93_00185 [Microbacterium sp. 3H14]|uniref:hypothetical protein n=1 Tax=Microbacterium sp. 3H14 TaxID=2555725 RepID=UPI00106C9CE3|nr:hypothetical protein [Microbacterium sp. 3H14]TFB15131.1 hypothetical protein E3V93_00075 [Microbacterium sp. 3H14]TFB15152.1 hypothetical protein E3V93_00185 [Microbacterium sp. 3H14]